MDVPVEFFGYLASAGLTMVSYVFGKKYRFWKRKAVEFAEACYVTLKAVEDDKVTEEEIKRIVEEWKDVFYDAKDTMTLSTSF